MMLLTDARIWPPVVLCGDFLRERSTEFSALGRKAKPIVRKDPAAKPFFCSHAEPRADRAMSEDRVKGGAEQAKMPRGKRRCAWRVAQPPGAMRLKLVLSVQFYTDSYC